MNTRKISEYRRRGATYYRAKINGRKVHLGRTLEEAQRRLVELGYWPEGLDGQPEPKPETTTPVVVSGPPRWICELAARWVALNDHPDNRRYLRKLSEAGGLWRTPLPNVPADFLRQYHAWLKRQTYKRPKCKPRPYSPAVVRDYVRVAAAVLRYGHEMGWVDRMPTRPRLDRSPRVDRSIPWSEVDAMLSDLPKHARRVCTFMAYTGARPDEARLLDWADVDLAKRRCHLTAHKNARKGQTRTLVLLPQAEAVLREIAEERQKIGGKVFRSGRSETYTASGLRSITKRCGFNPRQLRTSLAQHMADTGANPGDVAAVLGHADLSMADHYFELREGRAEAALASVFPVTPGDSASGGDGRKKEPSQAAS